jgi:sulfatase modifying factor 1
MACSIWRVMFGNGCADWYDANYYKSLTDTVAINPRGAKESYDPEEPYTPKKSLRGGSFLCNDSYCSGYRVSRRMKSSPDTGLEHTELPVRERCKITLELILK